MRNNLVTVFHCGDCGNPLTLLYPEEAEKPNNDCLQMSPRLDSGAFVRMNRISIRPCSYCKEKYSRPALEIARALKDIGNL